MKHAIKSVLLLGQHLASRAFKQLDERIVNVISCVYYVHTTTARNDGNDWTVMIGLKMTAKMYTR